MSVCLQNPVDLGWDEYGGSAFAKRCGEKLWGSKWYEVMPKPAPSEEYPNWGLWAKKLEVLLVVRIPSLENRDKKRIVPGRPYVYIVPASDCVPDCDGHSYFSNTKIQQVLILKPCEEGSKDLLGKIMMQGSSRRVQLTSSRDDLGAMIGVALATVPADSLVFDDQIDGMEVSLTTASVVPPVDPTITRLQRHRGQWHANKHKQVWPENISRFTPDEMRAALHSIQQQQLRSYSLAFHYTTEEQAVKMCQRGSGIDAQCTVTTRSPIDLGWDQYAGGGFKHNATQLLAQDPNLIQAVLVLAIPTATLRVMATPSFTIPQELLTAANGSEHVYANAHVHKSYVLTTVGAGFGMPNQSQGAEQKTSEPKESARILPPALSDLQARKSRSTSALTLNPVATDRADAKDLEQAQFEQGAQLYVAAQRLTLRKSPRRGSDHVVQLRQGDCVKVVKVIVDDAGTHLNVETLTVDGKTTKRCRSGWINPVDGAGNLLVRPTPRAQDSVFEQEGRTPRR
eukprot:COSAG02_NODE_4009_length_5918_cov_10.500086_3_plen_511_part_00